MFSTCYANPWTETLDRADRYKRSWRFTVCDEFWEDGPMDSRTGNENLDGRLWVFEKEGGYYKDDVIFKYPAN
jgi:hypothetical protein